MDTKQKQSISQRSQLIDVYYFMRFSIEMVMIVLLLYNWLLNCGLP